MFKVMTIIGTRPELIKMSRVIAEFDLFTEHTLVHTGQNYDYELNEIFFKDLEIRRPDYFLDAVGANAAQTISKVIAKADEVLDIVKPDAVLLYGDTNSCLSVISAKRKQIPVFHMEAGNRCFDERVPEELNRKILDHLSDVNFVLTEHARRYLIQEGLRSERIFKTGSHMAEVLRHYRTKIASSDVVSRLQLTASKYFLVSAHREENVDYDENMRNLLETLNCLAEQYALPVIVSTHPRTMKKLNSLNGYNFNALVRFEKPLGFFDYIALQISAFCVISDSGTITEEADLLNLPAVTIRNAHERPEGMDAGTLVMSGLKPSRVLNAVKVVTKQREKNLQQARVGDYDSPAASKQILRVVLSYIDYVNRLVWHKS